MLQFIPPSNAYPRHASLSLHHTDIFLIKTDSLPHGWRPCTFSQAWRRTNRFSKTSAGAIMSNASLLIFTMEWSGTIGVVLLLFMTVHFLNTRYRKSLRDIPGPFLASILPLDRLLSTARGYQFATHLEYHRKYGQLVRVGPNHVSFSDAEAIPLVYSINTKYFKAGCTSFPPSMSTTQANIERILPSL